MDQFLGRSDARADGQTDHHLRSAKGAARTARQTEEPFAPHSVLREFLKSSPIVSRCHSDSCLLLCRYIRRSGLAQFCLNFFGYPGMGEFRRHSDRVLDGIGVGAAMADDIHATNS